MIINPKKDDKVRLPDGRDGIIYSVLQKKGAIGYPYDELQIMVDGTLVTAFPWTVTDLTGDDIEIPEIPEEVLASIKPRGRPKKNAERNE